MLIVFGLFTSQDTNESTGQYLTVLVEFVQALKEKLKIYNEERRSHFHLRAGAPCYVTFNAYTLIL